MIPIEHIQFAGIVMTGALTLMLLFLLPLWAAGGRVFTRSRWLMTVGTALLPIHFLLQYTLHFRQMGVTQGVMVNMIFFIPCAVLSCLSILNLLRQGVIKRHEWLIGAVTYLIVVCILIGANMIDGEPILTDTAEMRGAELISAVVYMILQLYYSWLNWQELGRLKRALDSFYDQEKDGVTRWMRGSTILMSIVALLTPLAIFWSGGWLLGYSVGFFLTIFYCVISFYSYGVDGARQVVIENAEQNAEDTALNDKHDLEPVMDETDGQRVERAVNKWVATGGHLKNGITMPMAAMEMKIPRYLLTAWLKTTEQELFSPWLAHLRIEEAKRLMREHPDWGNDVIAEQCGFNTRNYFQTVFRKQTGMTPAQFVASPDPSERGEN